MACGCRLRKYCHRVEARNVLDLEASEASSVCLRFGTKVQRRTSLEKYFGYCDYGVDPEGWAEPVRGGTWTPLTCGYGHAVATATSLAVEFRS